jgi:hypothetical protein
MSTYGGPAAGKYFRVNSGFALLVPGATCRTRLTFSDGTVQPRDLGTIIRLICNPTVGSWG